MIFRYTILYVDDVSSSLDFFVKAFGFERGFLHESGDYGELLTGETKLAFSSRTLMRQLDKDPALPRPDAPTFEIAFETEDVAGTLQRALDAGATLIQDARDEPWGQTTSYVADPNGYLIEICTAVQLPG
ncbi:MULTISPECIES: VOC family protein [Alphaproteobacteria]|uniref:VOC family protein n=1 Tax=Alphaproteobacteria TaxID=28211 RepID=UPI0019D3AEF5|nr:MULTISPECIES: VOC family protein [Alphaproteobacteria]MBY6024146.1 VOC family protein [Nitratireductor sp. DP7N14-4]MBN7758860.1 VOC family protein [Nitratireductor aquimarinus]MBN7760789.1 VOC family protein [Nitratireductor aquibiodomus]MBN7778424.1 VOC family protein [Nitratireductor pacificus]MBN7782746.1 VOC family protein [Nitratireductor pacificus]